MNKCGNLDNNAGFDGAFPSGNYEFQSPEHLAKTKRAELKPAALGTRNILDMATEGNNTYYVTADQGVWHGVSEDIKVLK